MSRDIYALDEGTINRIAAGEVVERPLSVVKELVENALDAGAKAVTVEIKDGGISSIRVTDNGQGIKKDQVRIAFLRHTTSKIRNASDLISITSLGFRGEALSSIASVAQVELLSKTADSLTGVRYCIEGSRETVFDDVGVPDGTTVIVRNIFFNTPARRKFLKTAVTEGGYISDYMEKVMLCAPDIAFKYIVNGTVKLQSFGNNNTPDIIYSIYGRDVMENMVPTEAGSGGMTVRGYVGKPVLARANRSFEIYFVNGRYIKSKQISSALDEAYKPYLMLHRYPFVVLYLELPYDEIDVNVHPSKMEVRFLNSEPLYRLITESVQKALKEQDMTVSIKSESKKAPVITEVIPEPFEDKRKAAVVKETESYERKETGQKEPGDAQAGDTGINVVKSSDETADGLKTWGFKIAEEEPAKEEYAGAGKVPYIQEIPPLQAEQLSLFKEEGLLSEEALPKHRIIGQLFKTYWLIELEDELFVIDQHAAHEKVNYERLVKQLHEKNVISQYINPPIIVTLSKSEETILLKQLDRFRECGFELENFGGSEYRISAIPTDLYGLTPTEYFHDVLDELSSEKLSGDVDEVLHRIATVSCKSAVKGNTTLSFDEAKALIDELMKLENPYHCPHGRPVIIKFGKTEIEKMFKRIV